MVTETQRVDFAHAVIIARVKRNWTMGTLASESGISIRTITRVEQAKPPDPERDTIVKLCECLQLDSRRFLFPSDE